MLESFREKGTKSRAISSVFQMYFQCAGWVKGTRNEASRKWKPLVLADKRGTPALHLNEPPGGSCCGAGLGLVWYCYCIYMTFVCLIQKKWIYFGLLRGQGCVESKNMTSAKGKSTMSSLDPPINQVASFKCRPAVPL